MNLVPGGEPEQGTSEWWDERYDRGEIPWDTGLVPPEVSALIGSGLAAPGWALDLGCGTGLNTRFLARHGFRAVGLDLAQSPLARARLAATAEGCTAYFCLADVTDLAFLKVRASIAIDVGCLHAVRPERRPRYVDSLAAHLLEGAPYLLYAHQPASNENGGPYGLAARDVGELALFFDLVSVQHGDDGGRPAAWYLMRRR